MEHDTTFTAGPWEATICDDGITRVVAIDKPTGHPILIAMPYFGDEIKANARLIAAAPELYEACQEAHALLYHYQLAREPNGVDWGPVEMLRQEMIDKLWHAITLAVPALKQGGAV